MSSDSEVSEVNEVSEVCNEGSHLTIEPPCHYNPDQTDEQEVRGDGDSHGETLPTAPLRSPYVEMTASAPLQATNINLTPCPQPLTPKASVFLHALKKFIVF